MVHPGGSYPYTRMEEIVTPGCTGYLHPGVEQKVWPIKTSEEGRFDFFARFVL